MRVGLLGALLVMVLGSAAVAQSPTPEATSPYAPDDMAFLLPRSVADITLEVEGGAGADYATEMLGVEVLQALLLPLEKEPADVRVASAKSDLNDMGQQRVAIVAMRVDGIDAAILNDHLLALSGLGVDSPPPGYSLEWQEVDGKQVLVLANADHEGWGLFYPKGEVLFMATTSMDAPEVKMEQVLAELP